MAVHNDMNKGGQIMRNDGRVLTDGGTTENGNEEREVADLELDDGDWLHDHEADETDTSEAADDGRTQREADEAERSEHLEEMAQDVASDLLREHVDGFGDEEADDRAEEVVGEYADDHGIAQWDEDDLDEFEIWARENLR